MRYRIVGLLFAGSAVNFIDRVNISVAAPAMMAATGWHKDKFGVVFSAFLLGYALMQIPAGYIADRQSPRKLLAWAFAGFSLFTLLTPLGVYSLAALLVLRVLVGVCEAATFPSITAFNAKWFPAAEFGRAQTISLSGGSFGQMIAYPLTAGLLLLFPWQVVFYVSSALGFLWIAAWLSYATDDPRTHPAVNPAELAVIKGDLERQQSNDQGSLRGALLTAPVLFLALSAMCFAFVLWTFLFWFPTYLIEGRGLSLSVIAIAGVGVQACGFLGTLSSGVISDRLFRATQNIRLARPMYAGGCVSIAAGVLLLAVNTQDNIVALVLFGIFFFFLQSVHVAYLASPRAICESQAATIFGFINCSAASGAILGPAIVGLLMRSSTDWHSSFAMISSVAIVSAVLLLTTPLKSVRGEAAVVPLTQRGGP